MAAPIRLLMVSPVPSHPADQGNAARLRGLAAGLRRRGILSDLLYLPYEGLTPGQRAAMEAEWPALHVLPPHRAREPSMPGAWGLDDWAPPDLGQAVARLVRAERYAAVLVHYVWLSAALKDLGEGVLRLLDTHDVFGDRHRTAMAAGLDPSWFWTTPAEEARGLARADLVLAIQDAEAAVLRARGAAGVLTVGHAPKPRFLLRDDPPGPVAFGCLASGNPWNVAAVRALDAALAAGGDAPEWLVAGSIWQAGELGLRTRPQRLHPLPERDAFYAAIGCALSPVASGTGLKIKTVEALAWGRPVLGLRGAFAGLDAEHPAHCAVDATALAALMRAHAASPAVRAEHALASRRLALRYAADVEAQLDTLAERISFHAREARGRHRRPAAAAANPN